MITRRKTKKIRVGNTFIGGDAPISVQTMVKAKEFTQIIDEIKNIESAGCDIVRVAVPDFDFAKKLNELKKITNMPIVADIHYNYRLAIESIKSGADKIRINPGNIGGKQKLKEIIKYLKEYNIPMRIGVNSGSLEKDILNKHRKPTANALCESIIRWVDITEEFDFFNIVLSIKSSDPLTTIEAYRMISDRFDYPLHLGVTSASFGIYGIVRSSIGIGTLLAEGIGDTIRVSLTGSSLEEIKLGKEILFSMGLRKGVRIISCPTCSRCEIDVYSIASKIEKAVSDIKKSITIAVMGCVVNGPGEAIESDIGVTGTKDYGIIFKDGKIIYKVPKNKVINALLENIKNIP